MRRLLALTMMGLLVLPATTAVAGALNDPRPRSHLADTLRDASMLSKLNEAARATGLIEELAEPGVNVTILAPSDEAFAKLPAGELDRLMQPENLTELARILKNHVLAGQVLAGTFDGKEIRLPSFTGELLEVDGGDGKTTVNGATVTSTDVIASNGVIHIIDQVLMPKS